MSQAQPQQKICGDYDCPCPTPAEFEAIMTQRYEQGQAAARAIVQVMFQELRQRLENDTIHC